MLKTLSSNQSHPLPIKIFEIADVVHPVSADVNPCMARNEKHLCALIASKTPCFEIIHGLCDWLMSSLGVEKGLSGYAIHEDNGWYSFGFLNLIITL